MERVKLHSIRNDFTDMYFWRTTSNNPHELDFLELKLPCLKTEDSL